MYRKQSIIIRSARRLQVVLSHTLAIYPVKVDHACLFPASLASVLSYLGSLRLSSCLSAFSPFSAFVSPFFPKVRIWPRSKAISDISPRDPEEFPIIIGSSPGKRAWNPLPEPLSCERLGNWLDDIYASRGRSGLELLPVWRNASGAESGRRSTGDKAIGGPWSGDFPFILRNEIWLVLWRGICFIAS